MRPGQRYKQGWARRKEKERKDEKEVTWSAVIDNLVGTQGMRTRQQEQKQKQKQRKEKTGMKLT